MSERSSRTLLGELLLADGLITSAQLSAALNRQDESQVPLGRVLVDMGALNARQLEAVLRRQARLRGTPGGAGSFILVVDDDPEVSAVVRDILAGAGYRVGVADNETEAVGRALASDEARPALIMLDLGLPGPGGIELLAWLREQDDTRDLPVVVLTGSPDLEDEIQRRQLHINRFLAKPVAASRLIEVIDAVLAEAHAPVQSWGG
ncbi:MAG: response regulator [Armatimonadetes bacterium]|nr:response regulator [Armatimonadota bacterium]